MGQSLPSSIHPRVSALLRMLGSPVDAEALGAARALGRTLAGVGCDFHDLADRLGGEPERIVVPSSPHPVPRTPRARRKPSGTVLWRAPQRRAVAERLRSGLHSRRFTSWEQKFAADIADMIASGQCRFTEKQVDTAEQLAAKAMQWSGRA